METAMVLAPTLKYEFALKYEGLNRSRSIFKACFGKERRSQVERFYFLKVDIVR